VERGEAAALLRLDAENKTMTIKEAESLGYSIIRVGKYKTALVRKGVLGVRHVAGWRLSDFLGRMPQMDHSRVQDAINLDQAPANDVTCYYK
jgi:hypothetical protein